MDTDGLKREAALAAMQYVRPHTLVGVGSGSTMSIFVEELAGWGHVDAAVAASNVIAEKLARLGIRVVDLEDAGELEVYVDSADEADPELRLIKGAGGAMTREKMLATRSARFVCAVDRGKLVDELGDKPVPVEVTPDALEFVYEELQSLGGDPVVRPGYLTDGGNPVLDVTSLPVSLDPEGLERVLDDIPGTVGNGLFAIRRADVLVVAAEDGVRALTP